MRRRWPARAEAPYTRDERYALAGFTALLVITAAWWALALWPVTDGPEWLARTRYVCFGVAESGLPDAGGWVGLIFGPLGMLTILLAGWSGGVRGLLRRARQSAAGAVPLGALALGTVLLLTGATVRIQQARTPDVARTEGAELPAASYPRLDRAAPPLVLTAQSGDGLDIGALRGRPVLVTFAFAHCETVCPVVVQHTLQAQAALPEALRPVVLVVTLDPWRDTPGRLGAMAAAWGLPASDAHVLSGTVPEVEAVLDAWEMPRFRDEVTGTVTHPALVYVLDRTGRIAFASNGDAATIAELVRRL